MSIEDVIHKINAAFGHVQLGSGTSLHQAEVIDCNGTPEEIAAARALDPEPHWSAIPDEKIEAMATAFNFMDAAGFRYHIPRFMIYALQRGATSQTSAGDAAITQLNVGDGPGREHQEAKFELLSTAQCRAITEFLRYCADDSNDAYDPDAKLALERYWKQFR